MFPVCHKIDSGSINNQYRKIALLGKKGKITLPDFFQVIRRDRLFIIPPSFPDMFDQLFLGQVQVNEQIRFWKPFINDFEEIPVEVVFILCQGILGKDERFHEVIIGNGMLMKQVSVGQVVFKLTVPFGQE